MVTQPPDPEHRERTVFADFDATALSELRGDPRLAPSVDTPSVVALPLYGNVHVLAPLPFGQDRLDFLAEAEHMAETPREELDPFDLPERDRMYELAVQFVSNHVRQVGPGSTLWARDRSFGEGALVVSEKPFPRLRLRPVRLNWVIDDHRVIDVQGQRALGTRFTRVTVPARRFIWAPGRGDAFDLAYLLGNLCAILGIEVPEPVAATGVVALTTNHVLGNDPVQDKRRAGEHDHMAHLILPFVTHLMPGEHHGVRYWPARDTNEAVYSLLAAASSDQAVPDLKHRWRVKMAYSWASLLATFLAIGVTEFIAAGQGFVGDSALLRWTLAIAAVLFAISVYCTHKYRRTDR